MFYIIHTKTIVTQASQYLEGIGEVTYRLELKGLCRANEGDDKAFI